jgi:xanthine dehydrogenase YagT iron-sulfur-binding subunit
MHLATNPYLLFQLDREGISVIRNNHPSGQPRVPESERIMSIPPCQSDDENDKPEASPSYKGSDFSRRSFVKTAAALGAGVVVGMPKLSAAQIEREIRASAAQLIQIKLHINGEEKSLTLDTRTSLLDALRENLGLMGSKKGCDHGQCGACTVLIGGRRINSCLTLAAVADGLEITTIEGLSHGDVLHPVQQSFLQHDGFQCGYCTPGQICSAVALLDETKRGELSAVSWKDKALKPSLTDDEIRERMSGNICRCGAYPNIVAAVRAAAKAAQV